MEVITGLTPARSKIVRVIAADKILADFARILLLLKGAKLSSPRFSHTNTSYYLQNLKFYARFHYATFHFYVMPDSFSMLCPIPLCMIPLCLIPVYCYARFQIQISTLCLIPLCHFLLYHFPLFCYDWFRYDRFRYAHFSFLKLYLIPLCHITLCPSPLWQVPRGHCDHVAI